MTLLSLLGRIMRYFLLRPETLFLLCISLALWSYFFHTDEVKTIVKSSRDAVKMVKGKVAEIMQNDQLGGLDVLDAEFSKTWEFKNHNVAVYSIQGRRDHMEDRFEVITDLVNKTHPSIFGIFDGHGGEASFRLVWVMGICYCVLRCLGSLGSDHTGLCKLAAKLICAVLTLFDLLKINSMSVIGKRGYS